MNQEDYQVFFSEVGQGAIPLHMKSFTKTKSLVLLTVQGFLLVPRNGIEPSTRGFSVLCSTD
jgi:hypothetical protein